MGIFEPHLSCTPRRYSLSALLSVELVLLTQRGQRFADKATKDILTNFGLLEKAVAQFDTRFTLRALRSISSLRKRLTGRILCQAILVTYPTSNPTAKVLLESTGETPSSVQSLFTGPDKKIDLKATQKKDVIPEIDVYVAILIQVWHTMMRCGVVR